MEFLCAAKEKKRSFRVFVAEGAPRAFPCKELVARGLQTTVITDSAVFAIISRVNMLEPTLSSVANGGVIAPVGMNMVALAAQRHAVPFVVLAGTHKLCPLYPHNPEVLLNELKSPAELMGFWRIPSDCLDYGSSSGSLLHVVNPAFDYVPPNLVSLFITDTAHICSINISEVTQSAEPKTSCRRGVFSWIYYKYMIRIIFFYGETYTQTKFAKTS
ncbi:hypothetical protein HAX54_038158 [Datura stramonium]|uniref:Translation initiation factor eIF2B subunit beta n=1 Tax=Datura stramonium TaxID=4076 RepID=A0ABS8VKQ6_DATST|nr:hypothetical protein [Datura stramonium]